jgi:hypothetical protein
MGEKLIVGPVNRGLKTDKEPFFIDNDNFPTLINAYQWRGRIKRKRGTAFVNRLTRYFNSTVTSYSSSATIDLVAGAANILTGFSLQSTGNIVPGTVTIVDTTASNTYTDNSLGVLTGTPSGSGTINYATGHITIVGGSTDAISATFLYTADLPVMGIEDYYSLSSQFTTNLCFDTTYSYVLLPTYPYNSYDVSFYKNPNTNAGTLPAYVAKTVWTPLTWNGADYQQFWSVNYSGAFWATNGITTPFTGQTTNFGMQFKPITGISISAAGPPAIVVLTIAASGLVIGDFVFINEVVGNTGINFQTGYVTAVSGSSVTVELPNATVAGSYSSGGIAQYLTNRSNPSLDCIRWYDGDPTNGSSTSPTFVKGFGWVNYMPPLSFGPYSIGGLPAAQYYLVGCKMIVPYRDRLLFFGPVLQTSATGALPIYLQDTVVYSQVGSPYYTSSFTGDPTLANTVFYPILVPANNVASASAMWEDIVGYGGFQTVGLDQPINTVSRNEDALIIGMETYQLRLLYQGNDITPFNFYIINSELGSRSTFATITLDKGVLSIGSRAFVITSQEQSARFDLDIPDSVFEIDLMNNGPQRITGVRDFINEWIYFTYPSNNAENASNYFPNQTLQYNYRDHTWGVFNESYTTYGTFRIQTGYTWATIGNKYPTWGEWNEPWGSGASTLLQPKIIAGNQQGFIILRDSGTGEQASLYIENISGSTVTSPTHNLNEGDYIVINGALGTVGTQVNGLVFRANNVTDNTFMLNPSIAGGTYIGSGTITRMYIPFIQTKQFPSGWGLGRKTRIGYQQYLITKTASAVMTLFIYLSENSNEPYNVPPIVPEPNVENSSLIYSTILPTSPEYYVQNCYRLPLGNIGNGAITTFNFNLVNLFDFSTVGIVPGSAFITVGSVATFTDNGLGVLVATGTGTNGTINYTNGAIVLNFSSAPTSQSGQVNVSYYVNDLQNPIALDQQQIWHRISTSLIGDTIQLGFTLSDSQMRDPTLNNQFAEIEVHGFILDIQASQELA